MFLFYRHPTDSAEDLQHQELRPGGRHRLRQQPIPGHPRPRLHGAGDIQQQTRDSTPNQDHKQPTPWYLKLHQGEEEKEKRYFHTNSYTAQRKIF